MPGAGLEPLEVAASLEGVHRAVDVLDRDRHPVRVGGRVCGIGVGRDEPVDDRGEGLGRGLGRLDRGCERDRGTHRREVGGVESVVGVEPFGQPVPAADELGGVLELELA